jgi:hypothetical protein
MTSMRRYLVVANQTLGGDQLTDKIRECMAAGPCRFHVVVPATPTGQLRRASAAVMPPSSGTTLYGVPGLPSTIEATDVDEHARAHAQARLGSELARLRRLGAQVDGEVGDPDPLRAARVVLSSGEFDAIILSTLPPRVSRWLRMDLPHRLRRSSKLPVVHVVGPPGAP